MAKRKKRPAKKGLTNQDKIFIQEYLISLKPYDAAIKAGYSKSVANSHAYTWISDPKIKPLVFEKIKEGIEKRLARYEVTTDNILAELAAIAFSDVVDIAEFSPKGVYIKDSKKLTKEQRRAISEVSQTGIASGRGVKVKMHDKIQALEKLGKHLGMWKEGLLATGKPEDPIHVIQRTIVDPQKPEKPKK